ncbi:MAG TPA: glucosaminidase domain-containing protein [Acidimicrobiia bacterium]|nr:glucosaminidase domain-containing protein [Acidimicrobiia bacterium]
MALFHRRVAALVVAFALASVASALGAAAPAAAATPTTQTPVMGPNLLSADQLAAWYRSKRGDTPPNVPGVNYDVRALAALFIEEGRLDGVRGDMAFVQSVLETGWFSYPDYGQIRPWFNNFAGMYAYDGREPGTTCEAETAPSRCFPTARIGVRTQIHLLRGYADETTRYMTGRLAKPPSDRIGKAPIWELFGGSSGIAIWATAPDYGLRIISLYSDAMVFNGARRACLPYSPSAVTSPSGRGYWLGTTDGAVHTFGDAWYYGSAKKYHPAAPIVGGEATSSGNGYWLLGRDGGIFSFGKAKFFGSTGNLRLNKPVNGMERSRWNAGYWLVADDGGVFSFGNARFFGSTGNLPLVKPVQGMEATKTFGGYWLFSSDGGVFSFGDAQFFGSLGGQAIAAPIVAMQRSATGNGYWMLGKDGRVYTFGDAKHYGDVRGCTNYKAAARLLVTPTGKGYWIATAEGTVIPFGDARRLGSPAWINGATSSLMLRP